MSWGDETHYYAKDPRDVVRLDAVALRWQKALAEANPQARAEVDRAVKQWNSAVRELLRNETGFRLSVPGDTRAVPVRVMDGLPAPVHKLLEDLPEVAFLLLWLTEIGQARRGTAFLSSEYERIARLVPDAVSHARLDEIEHTRKFADALLAKLEELKFRDKWKAVTEDLLGAYFFRRPEIHIYWVPIGLVAAGLQVPPHVLTIVVLAHELAHAYTHLGMDIDGVRWNTKSFASSDLDIVEGLAEFYCRAVCDGLDAKSIGARAVFDRLQEWSTGPYLAYKRWLTADHDPSEIIRTTMIEARRTGITKTKVFEDVMGEYRQNLTGQRGAAGR